MAEYRKLQYKFVRYTPIPTKDLVCFGSLQERELDRINFYQKKLPKF